jgi:hypothetical protein
VSIPCDNLLDDDYFLSSVSFSKRGSIMFGGDPAIDAKTSDLESIKTPTNDDGRAVIPTPTTPVSQSQARPSSDTAETDDDLKKNYNVPLMSPPDIRVLAADVEKESQKVRSLYSVGDSPYGEPGSRRSYCERLEPTPEAPSEDNDNVPYGFLAVPSSHLRIELQC